MASAGERILVVGQAWVGDMVLSQSLYRSLKHRCAESTIDVVAPACFKPLLERMPEVSSAIAMPAGHGELNLRARYRLGRQLAGRGYDRAIVIPGSLKAALLPWFARIPVRTGYRGEMRFGLINDIRRLDRRRMPRNVARFVYLGEPPGTPLRDVDTPAPALTIDQDQRDSCVRRLGLEVDAKVLALMPGAAYGPAKQWPVGHFVDVARRYADRGWRVWVFGSAAERSIGVRIAQAASDRGTSLCGNTTLVEAVDLVSLADLAIANDSGLMHIAAAVGCPVIAIYGATDPACAPPMISRARSLQHKLDCTPCWDRTCRYGHYRCLRDVSPDEVQSAADQISS